MGRQGPLSGLKLGGKYRLDDLLGQGGFGVVYRGEHLLLHRPQAIKILLEQHITHPKSRESFKHEAAVLAAMDHPNIVHLDDFGMDGHRAYIVMPYIQGGTLATYLEAFNGPLKIETVEHFLAQICSALDYAHARQVVHLDLKPMNLLLHQSGQLLLADFGLAHLVYQGIAVGGSSLQAGTPPYMSPEHLHGEPRRRSDIYALGVILYQMLAGRLPFEGASVILQILQEPPPPLRRLRPELGAQLEPVVEKALAKKPEARYSTCAELLADFRAALKTGARRRSVQPVAAPRVIASPSTVLPLTYMPPAPRRMGVVNVLFGFLLYPLLFGFLVCWLGGFIGQFLYPSFAGVFAPVGGLIGLALGWRVAKKRARKRF